MSTPQILIQSLSLSLSQTQLQSLSARHAPGLFNPAAHEIVHPCDQWARAAGYGSWHAALLAMKEGCRVLCAHMSQIDSSQGKSNLSLDLFMEEIAKQDLHAWSEDGFLYLGLRENFSPALLKRQEEACAQMVQALGG